MESLMKYIGRLNRLAILHRSVELEAEGLNGLQHSYVLRICSHPGVTQDQLSHMLYVHKSNVARQLALLERAGYISRVPKEGDKRALEVYPTDKMRAVYPKVRAVLDEWNAYLLEDFTPEECAALVDMLTRMTEKAAGRVEAENALRATP